MRANKIEKTELHRSDKRPIAKFYRCWLEDVANGVAAEKRRGINQEQFRAADRIASNYEKAFCRGGHNFIKLRAIKAYGKSYTIENQLQAIHDYRQVFCQLNKKSQEIIEHFCLHELPLREFELKQIPQWTKGVGSARLREALDDLIKIYENIQ